MPRTDPQRLASRLNGSLSKGPTSALGRLASSRNATKHGLSGAGKHLPPDMEHELQQEIALHVSKLHPRDPYEHDLIRRAALGNLRARRIASTLNALTDDRVRNATRLWDESRAHEIANLAARLRHNPSESLRLLLRSSEGCDFLGDSWESLAQSLSAQGFWNHAQAQNALHLLGLASPPDLSADTPESDFWRCALSLLFRHDPASTLRSYFPNHPEVVRQLPSAPDAREALSLFLNDHIASLEAQGAHLWQTYDLPARQSASTRSAFDPSPESARLDRYLAAAERMRRQALDELARLRKNEPAPPQTPAIPALTNSHDRRPPQEKGTGSESSRCQSPFPGAAPFPEATPQPNALSRNHPTPSPNNPAPTSPNKPSPAPNPQKPPLSPLSIDLFPPPTTLPLTIGRPS